MSPAGCVPSGIIEIKPSHIARSLRSRRYLIQAVLIAPRGFIAETEISRSFTRRLNVARLNSARDCTRPYDPPQRTYGHVSDAGQQ